MAQVITGSTTATIAASTTRYMGPMGLSGTPQTTNALAYQIVPTDGTFSLLALKSIGGSPVTLATATLYKNGSATALTCGTSTTAVGHDSVNSVSVSAGDTVSIEIVVAGGATSRAYGYSLVFTPTTATESILMGSSDTSTPVANHFCTIANPLTTSATENNVRQVMPETSGVLKKLYVAVDTDPTVAASAVNFTVFNNSIASAVVATVNAGSTTANDTANSATIAAAGNVASIRVTVTGSPTLSAFHFGVVYEAPSGTGYFLMLGSTGANNMSNAGTRYEPCQGSRGVTTNENLVAIVSNAFTAKSMYCRLGAAPGAGNTWDLPFRVNGGSSAISVNITGAAATTGSSTADVAVALDDIINVAQIPTGTPTGTTWKYGLVGSLPNPASTATRLALLGVG